MRLTASDWLSLSRHCSGEDASGGAASARGGLAALGLLSDMPGTPAAEADRGRLFAFAQARALTMDLFEVPGGILAAANLDISGPSGFKRLTASGKGFSAAEAILRCLGEAVEVTSWAFRARDRARLLSAPEPCPHLSAGHVLGFSQDQIRDREVLNGHWEGWDAIPPSQQLDRADLWTQVRSLDGRLSAACPAFLCFGGFGRAVHGDDRLNADSNGCAAGPTFEAAALSAMLEITERDATGIWWWRGCRRGRIDPSGLGDAGLLSALAEHGGETGRRSWFLDISALPGAAVVVAVSCNRAGGDVALGFGSGLRLADAARSAFLEMLQTELAMDAQEVRALGASGDAVPDSDRRIVEWRQTIDLARLPFLAGDAIDAGRDILAVEPAPAADLLHSLSAAGGLWFADLSRPDIGVPVVKALAAGLAHFKPRLGCERLWTVPEQQRWATTYARGVGAPPFLLM